MANNNNDKVLETLADMVPAEHQAKMTDLVKSMLDEATKEIADKYDAEYNAKLEEGFAIIADERQKDWQTAEAGYKQAYDLIADLRTRLARQEEEFQQTLEEEYQSAYEVVLAERRKNEDLESTLYKEFDERVKKIQSHLVDQMDAFLDQVGDEYYEAARREVLNDPFMAEHRIAFDKVVNVVKDYISDEDIMLNTNTKVDELERKLESVEVTKRQIEAKNMRLMTENNKMQEYLKETKEILEKNVLNEQNERLALARKVEGRGKTVNEPQREVVLGETVDSSRPGSETVDNEPRSITEQWQVLAGLR